MAFGDILAFLQVLKNSFWTFLKRYQILKNLRE
jgi:hypothetical protein